MNEQKRALVLGIGGQDGSYLAEILLEKGYAVHGLVRRSSVDNLTRIRHLLPRLTLHRGDLLDHGSVQNAVDLADPSLVFNEADQDDARWSVSVPAYQFAVTAGAVAALCKMLATRTCRLFQPLSALMFGNASPPQNEDTPLDPQSPFADAKKEAWEYCKLWRERGLHVSCGIMFNHDSESRSDAYALHKVCKAAARIKQGKQDVLELHGDPRVVFFDAGYARDYMLAAWQMLQLDKPDDFVIGTGRALSLWQMTNLAFAAAGVNLGCVKLTPADSGAKPQPVLLANPAKARKAFGFAPETTVERLVELIVAHHLKYLD